MLHQGVLVRAGTGAQQTWQARLTRCRSGGSFQLLFRKLPESGLPKLSLVLGIPGINTASSCDGPMCFVPELVAASVYHFDLKSASDPDPFIADSLPYVITQPCPVVNRHFRHIYMKPLHAC